MICRRMCKEIVYGSEVGEVTVELPLSKSMAARVIVARWLAGVCGSEIGSPADGLLLPDCGDTTHMLDAVGKVMGRGFSDDGHEACIVDLGEGGTTVRFFMAVAASLPGLRVESELAPQIAQRPLSPLVDALVSLGGRVGIVTSDDENAVRYTLYIEGRKLEGGSVELDASVSSQFVSALMLAAPCWRRGLSLSLAGDRVVSRPYVEMTAEVMKSFGVDVTVGDRLISVRPGCYRDRPGVRIEPDWSAAAFVYETVLLAGCGMRVRINGLIPHDRSVQGDAICASLFSKLGVVSEFDKDGVTVFRDDALVESAKMQSRIEPLEFDFTDAPDLVPYFAVAMAAADIHFCFRGVGHLRHKESDRINAIIFNMAQAGCRLKADADTLVFEGGMEDCRQDAVEIMTYGDHRMAMAFAPLACLGRRIVVDNPGCVSKSFVSFWEQLARLGIS